jgi:PAS domain S-box-containing protein
MLPEELLDEEGRGRFRKRMRQTLAGEKVSEQAEYRVRAKEGREIWVVLTTTISYEKGKARSVSVIAHDITERKRMEREIESLARFPMENPNPVLRIQHDGIIAFANAASSNLLRLWNRAVGEHLPETEYKLLLQVLESRTAIEQEIDCAGRIYSLIFTPIAEGGYVNIYGRDITERVQAEGALRRAQMDLERAQEVGQIGSWRLDVRQNILTWSDENHRIFGVPVGTPMSYETFLRIVHPNDRQYVDAQWDASLAGAPYDIEHRIIVDGRVKWVREKAYLEFDDAGDLLGGFGITQDITERKQAEINLSASKEQLRLLNETLEQKVNNQTAEVRRLTASLTKAEQRERSRIAHILHDDLQQRLYAVKMRLAFLTDGNMVDAAMEKEVSELDKQLAEILLLTRHLTIELSPPVLRDEGLRQAIEWLAFQMDEKLGMRVEVQAEESFATEDETVQVLLFNCVRELLFNIVKHAGVNRAVVSLQRSGDHLQIKVQDDGKGFDVATLFGKSKNDRGDTEEGKESFGLPTLRHQLSLLGGQMEIQSEPGAGTRITITIPNS